MLSYISLVILFLILGFTGMWRAFALGKSEGRKEGLSKGHDRGLNLHRECMVELIPQKDRGEGLNYPLTYKFSVLAIFRDGLLVFLGNTGEPPILENPKAGSE
jgi:hypothetical protein